MNDETRMLTTIDNPHNPKTDYLLWRQWDVEMGYNTEAFVARLIDMEDDDYEVDDDIKIKELHSKVVQEILENDVLQVYILV